MTEVAVMEAERNMGDNIRLEIERIVERIQCRQEESLDVNEHHSTCLFGCVSKVA